MLDMADWFEKLQSDLTQKEQSDAEESRRRANHDAFISAHGYEAWRELMAKVQEGCQRISSRRSYTYAPASSDGKHEAFIITGGENPLDVECDLQTRSVSWHVRNTNNRGKLKPDRQENEFVYRDNGNTYAVEDAAAFLLRKAFGIP